MVLYSTRDMYTSYLNCFLFQQSPESLLPKPSLTNEYETVAPASPTEATGDNVLLFRTTWDGPSPQSSQEQSNNQGGPAPSIPPPIPEKGADLTS